MKKIDFKQRKYIMPAILYFPLMGLGWLILDIFNVNIPEKDNGLVTTEYLNGELPSANVRDKIGSKRQNMMDSYSGVFEETAVQNLENDNDSVKKREEYYSRLSESELALLEAQAKTQQERDAIARARAAKQKEDNANRKRETQMGEDDFILPLTAEQRAEAEKLRKQKEMEKLAEQLGYDMADLADNAAKSKRKKKAEEADEEDNEDEDDDWQDEEDEGFLGKAKGKLKSTVDGVTGKIKGAVGGIQASAEGGGVRATEAVTALDKNAKGAVAIKAPTMGSTRFNTISENEDNNRLIKAIIDEEVKAVDGSRVRLRLLDDIITDGVTIKKGTYLYAKMSGFSQQRVQGSVESVLVGDELHKLNLTIYDTDGLEGLYVPESAFRETAKDVVGGAAETNMNMNMNNGYGNSITQWANQALQNGYQKVSQAIGKAIKKNRVRLKYGTHVYLVNGNESVR